MRLSTAIESRRCSTSWCRRTASRCFGYSALDIARVEAADALHDPERVLPALIASDRAAPDNYVASLRLAQVELDAKRYADVIAACDRGLAHVTGPLATSWLLQLRAKAFVATGRRDDARRALARALEAAQQIGPRGARATPRRFELRRAVNRELNPDSKLGDLLYQEPR